MYGKIGRNFIHVHHLKQKAEQYGIKNPIIQVGSQVSLNGRPYQPIVDPAINLAEAPLSIFAPSPWILPLEVSHLDQDNAANREP